MFSTTLARLAEIIKTMDEYAKYARFEGGYWILSSEVVYGTKKYPTYSVLPALQTARYFAQTDLTRWLTRHAEELIKRYNDLPREKKYPLCWRETICSTSVPRFGKMETTKFEVVLSSYQHFRTYEDKAIQPALTLNDVKVNNLVNFKKIYIYSSLLFQVQLKMRTTNRVDKILNRGKNKSLNDGMRGDKVGWNVRFPHACNMILSKEMASSIRAVYAENPDYARTLKLEDERALIAGNLRRRIGDKMTALTPAAVATKVTPAAAAAAEILPKRTTTPLTQEEMRRRALAPADDDSVDDDDDDDNEDDEDDDNEEPEKKVAKVDNQQQQHEPQQQQQVPT